MTSTEDLLSRSLHARAERAAYEPTPVAEVAERAQRMRRRRHRSTALAAGAIVVAVALPAVVVLGDDNPRNTDPARPSPSPSPSIPSEAADTFVAGLEQGPPPAIDYLQGSDYVSGDERTTLPLPDITTAAPYRGGYLVTWGDAEGQRITYLDESLDEEWTRCGGPIAVSRDRQVMGYLSGACGVAAMTLTLGPTDEAAGGELTAPGVTNLKGILDDGRAVYATSTGTVVSDLDGPPERTPFTEDVAFLDVSDLDETNEVVAIYDTGRAPAGVMIAGLMDGNVTWQKADYGWGLGRFSPDGSWLTGVAYARPDITRYTILDAASGKPAAAVELPADVKVEDLAWEDERHVLMAVREVRTRTVLRVDLDGDVTRAAPVVWGELGFRLTVQP